MGLGVSSRELTTLRMARQTEEKGKVVLPTSFVSPAQWLRGHLQGRI